MDLQHSGIVVLFLLSAYGWGKLGSLCLDRRVFKFHSLTAIVGLAVLNAIGGVLNLLGLARSWMLLLLLLAGAVVGAREILRLRPWRRREFPAGTIPLFVAAAFAALATLLLVPAGLFNIHDDFHTYATRAVRMVQTGSLGGNAFDPLGLDSLGSQSFFHGFFLRNGRLELLNGFDAAACFALCLFLVAELSLRWRLPWWLGAAAVPCLVWINPQFVNISPLYSGVAGVMALALCGALAARSLLGPLRISQRPLALTLGLIVAWLVTLKITLAAFAGCFALCLFVLLWLKTARRRELIGFSCIVAATAVVVVLPWALAPLPSLLQAWQATGAFAPSAELAAKYPSLAAHDNHLLLHPVRLFYGDTPPLYAALAALALGLGLAGLVPWVRNRGNPRLAGLAAVAAAGVAATVALILHAHLFAIGTAIRYSCPVLVGSLFFVALGYLRFRSRAATPARTRVSAALAVGCLGILIAFHGTFLARFNRVLRDRSLLAFPVDRTYAGYCRAMQGADEAAYSASLQASLPPGATALIWTVAPFHFDFTRNHLLTVSEPGLINPALRFPVGIPPADLEDYLRRNGVRYVLLEKAGYGVKEIEELERMMRSPYATYRKLAEYGIYLRRGLAGLAERGTVRHSDDRMLLFELHGDEPARSKAGNLAAHPISMP